MSWTPGMQQTTYMVSPPECRLIYPPPTSENSRSAVIYEMNLTDKQGYIRTRVPEQEALLFPSPLLNIQNLHNWFWPWHWQHCGDGNMYTAWPHISKYRIVIIYLRKLREKEKAENSDEQLGGSVCPHLPDAGLLHPQGQDVPILQCLTPPQVFLSVCLPVMAMR